MVFLVQNDIKSRIFRCDLMSKFHMNDKPLKQSETGLGQRLNLLVTILSRRNKRRAHGRAYAIWPAAFSFVLISAVLLALSAYFAFDERAVLAAKEVPQLVARFFRLITDVGKSEWILIPSGLMCLLLVSISWQRLSNRRKVWMSRLLFDVWFMFLSVGASGLLANLMKYIVGRARPKHLEPLGFGYFDPLSFNSSFLSFPSGHSITIAAFATVLALRFPRYTILFAGLALLVGTSRVIVGAHYPSDVIMGLTIGLLFTLVMARAYAIRKTGFRFVDGDKGVKSIPRRRMVNEVRG